MKRGRDVRSNILHRVKRISGSADQQKVEKKSDFLLYCECNQWLIPDCLQGLVRASKQFPGKWPMLSRKKALIPMACLLIIMLPFDMCCEKGSSPLNINEAPLAGRESGNIIKGLFINFISLLQPHSSLLCSIPSCTFYFMLFFSRSPISIFCFRLLTFSLYATNVLFVTTERAAVRQEQLEFAWNA